MEHFQTWKPFIRNTNLYKDQHLNFVTKFCNQDGITLSNNAWLFGSVFQNIEQASIQIEDGCQIAIIERTLFQKCSNTIFKFSHQEETFTYLEKVCILESNGPNLKSSKLSLIARDVVSYLCGKGVGGDFFRLESSTENPGEVDIHSINISKNNYKQCSGISLLYCNKQITASMFDGNVQNDIFLFYATCDFSITRSTFLNIEVSDNNKILCGSYDSNGIIDSCIFTDNKGALSNFKGVTLIRCFIKNTQLGYAISQSPNGKSNLELHLIDEFGCENLPQRKSCRGRFGKGLCSLFLVSSLGIHCGIAERMYKNLSN